MGQDTLVDRQIESGQKLVEALVQDGFDVTVAGWVRASEQDWWRLYIASKEVDAKGSSEAYLDVISVLRRRPDLWIEPLQIRLISATDPIAEDMAANRSRVQTRFPTHYRGARLGDLSIEEAFIFPA